MVKQRALEAPLTQRSYDQLPFTSDTQKSVFIEIPRSHRLDPAV